MFSTGGKISSQLLGGNSDAFLYGYVDVGELTQNPSPSAPVASPTPAPIGQASLPLVIVSSDAYSSSSISLPPVSPVQPTAPLSASEPPASRRVSTTIRQNALAREHPVTSEPDRGSHPAPRSAPQPPQEVPIPAAESREACSQRSVVTQRLGGVGESPISTPPLRHNNTLPLGGANDLAVQVPSPPETPSTPQERPASSPQRPAPESAGNVHTLDTQILEPATPSSSARVPIAETPIARGVLPDYNSANRRRAHCDSINARMDDQRIAASMRKQASEDRSNPPRDFRFRTISPKEQLLPNLVWKYPDADTSLPETPSTEPSSPRRNPVHNRTTVILRPIEPATPSSSARNSAVASAETPTARAMVPAQVSRWASLGNWFGETWSQFVDWWEGTTPDEAQRVSNLPEPHGASSVETSLYTIPAVEAAPDPHAVLPFSFDNAKFAGEFWRRGETSDLPARPTLSTSLNVDYNVYDVRREGEDPLRILQELEAERDTVVDPRNNRSTATPTSVPEDAEIPITNDMILNDETTPRRSPSPTLQNRAQRAAPPSVPAAPRSSSLLPASDTIINSVIPEEFDESPREPTQRIRIASSPNSTFVAPRPATSATPPQPSFDQLSVKEFKREHARLREARRVAILDPTRRQETIEINQQIRSLLKAELDRRATDPSRGEALIIRRALNWANEITGILNDLSDAKRTLSRNPRNLNARFIVEAGRVFIQHEFGNSIPQNSLLRNVGGSFAMNVVQLGMGEGVNYGVESFIGRDTTWYEHGGINLGTMFTTSVISEVARHRIAESLVRSGAVTMLPSGVVQTTTALTRAAIVNNLRCMPMGFANMLPISLSMIACQSMMGVDPNSRFAQGTSFGTVTLLGALSTNATIGGISAATATETSVLVGSTAGFISGLAVALSAIAGVAGGHYIVDPFWGWAGNLVLDRVTGHNGESHWMGNDGTLSDILASAGSRFFNGAAASASARSLNDDERVTMSHIQRDEAGNIIGYIENIPDLNSRAPWQRTWNNMMISVGNFLGI